MTAQSPPRAPTAIDDMRSLTALSLIGALLLSACGADQGGGTTTGQSSVDRGREVSRTKGCAACHGQNGEGVVAPSWVGLMGTTVQMDDGRQVVVDRSYLRRSIVDPGAEQVEGYEILMPVVPLEDREIEDVLDYIESLS